MDYIQRFASLVDQLAANEGHLDQMHYTMHFIDGLKESCCAAILLQCPSTLDTTYVLAQLQEEVAESGKPKEYKKWDSHSSKSSPRHPLPLPTPPLPHWD